MAREEKGTMFEQTPSAPAMTPELAEKLRRFDEMEAALAAEKQANAALTAELRAKGIHAGAPDVEADENGMLYYKIDLPPSGGISLRINGVDYFHGQTYAMDTPTLQGVRDMVHRSWEHERNIMGSNENAYRRELRPILGRRV